MPDWDGLVSPEAIAEAVRIYHEQRNQLNQERPAMTARMAELKQQKAETEARLREFVPDIPDINPDVAERYRRKVQRASTRPTPRHARSRKRQN
ncbi:MAG: hypothetical protein ACREFD_00615 [Stellaceae bacterium]